VRGSSSHSPFHKSGEFLRVTCACTVTSKLGYIDTVFFVTGALQLCLKVPGHRRYRRS